MQSIAIGAYRHCCCCRIFRHTYSYICMQVTICRINDNNDYTPHPSKPSIIHLFNLTLICICKLVFYSLTYNMHMHVCVYVDRCIDVQYTFSHVNKRIVSIKKSNTYCALCIIEERGKIEIQYLFDGFECLLSSKLSLYAFWQQSLLIETEKTKRVFFLSLSLFLSCSLLHAK